MKAYVHKDNSISIPFCDVGKKVIYVWCFNSPYINLEDEDCCGVDGCTCGNNESISRVATQKEADNFFQSFR